MPKSAKPKESAVVSARVGRRAVNAIHDRQAILSWIVQFKRGHDGNSPTLRQIARGCRISSTSVMAFHLQKLAKEGRIRIVSDTARCIEVVGGRWTFGEEK